MTTTKSLEITPKSGFCIKSATLNEPIYEIIGKTIPQNTKVFLNLCYHDSIPRPPPEEEKEDFVPLVLSDGRVDTDKSGKPALTFDAIFHPSVKSKILRSHDYKSFIVEVALQHVESVTSFQLSRKIGTPNIASKGKLAKRVVRIPDLSSTSTPSAVDALEADKKKPLIEEVVSPKSILKSTEGPTQQHAFAWNWTKSDPDRLQISISVPRLTPDLISQSTLDLEPRRLVLTLPTLPAPLDINLNKSDAEIVSSSKSKEAGAGYLSPESNRSSGDGDEVQRILLLKRQRVFDVQNATAEWSIQGGKLVITV